MNIFDVAVCIALLVAVVIGFRAGLLRSGVTILGYLLAMPIAIWIGGFIMPRLDASVAMTPQDSLVLFAIFAASGMVLGSLLRAAINDTIGHKIGLGDRLGGGLLGAIRVGLIAVTWVLIFDQLLPANRQPAYMTTSQLRPWLSWAAQKGVKSLPPDVVVTIEHWKRARGI